MTTSSPLFDPTTAPAPSEEREPMLMLAPTGSMNFPAADGTSIKRRTVGWCAARKKPSFLWRRMSNERSYFMPRFIAAWVLAHAAHLPTQIELPEASESARRPSRSTSSGGRGSRPARQGSRRPPTTATTTPVIWCPGRRQAFAHPPAEQPRPTNPPRRVRPETRLGSS